MAGILSANLAVVNILPFPPLDGGRMLMITLKRFFGARMSVRAEQLTYMVGFVFLFAFLIWVTGFDIVARPGRRIASPAMSSPDALRPRRRPTVSVDVGGVLVGLGPPGRRPVDDQHRHRRRRRDRDPGRPPGPRRLAARPGDGQHRRGGGRAVPEMVRKVRGLGVDVPIIGDFHYNGHKLLVDYPEMAAALAKYRINPGNVGAKRHDEHFATIIQVANDNDKPVRIGVNWGSLDQAILTELMDANARVGRRRATPAT